MKKRPNIGLEKIVSRFWGSIVIKILILQNFVSNTRVDIVKGNFPPLMGLDFPNKYRLYVNNIENLLCSSDRSLAGLPVGKRGHMYLNCDNECNMLSKDKEPINILRNLFYPASGKLYNLHKLAKP